MAFRAQWVKLKTPDMTDNIKDVVYSGYDQFNNDKRNLYEKLSSVFYGGHFTGFGDGFRSRLVFVGLFCPLYI